jgi:hypothetical protein
MLDNVQKLLNSEWIENFKLPLDYTDKQIPPISFSLINDYN